jgi:hypothetical protein
MLVDAHRHDEHRHRPPDRDRATPIRIGEGISRVAESGDVHLDVDADPL